MLKFYLDDIPTSLDKLPITGINTIIPKTFKLPVAFSEFYSDAITITSVTLKEIDCEKFKHGYIEDLKSTILTPTSTYAAINTSIPDLYQLYSKSVDFSLNDEKIYYLEIITNLGTFKSDYFFGQ